MRVVVIGATGHVGTYLVPRLVEQGHEVIALSRGQREPYTPHAAWKSVQQIAVDRAAEDAAGTFGGRVRDLKPDAVVDMICFDLDSAKQIVEALRGQVQHFVHCGTIWMYGHSVTVPADEARPRRPQGFDPYGGKKAAIEAYLMDEARRNGFPATVLMPGHIVGPGWDILNPQGNFNQDIFGRLARGEEVVLANFGMETVHHVHADDVAQMFQGALEHRSAAMGESFHTVSSGAVTMRGYAEAVASWFGREANLRFLGWNEYCRAVSEDEWRATYDHIARSPNASIARAQRLLDYRPRYTSLEAIYEAVMWMVEHEVIRV